MTDKAIRSAKLTAAGILDKARARTAVTRAGGQIAPSKYLPNVPRQVHAGGGRVGYEDGGDVGGTEPKNTVKAYKLFKRKKDGNIYPLFVNANKPVPIGQWLDAEEGPQGKSEGKVKSSLGDLAYRPGWHAGDLPVATHIGGKSKKELTAPDYRPDDHVWAEVEMPNDVDWQSVANSRMRRTADGRPILNTAHITDQLPKGGFYRYKTNPNMTGNWLIGGSMKVNRILHDDEVKQINDAAGTADLPRMPNITKAGGGNVEGDNGHIYVVHGGSDFDQIDPSYSGRGEPGNIRPLGNGLYGYVLDHTDPESAENAIGWATRYSQKYGGGKKALHVYKIPKSSSTVFNGQREINPNGEGYPKPIKGLGMEPQEKMAAYMAHRATEPPHTDPAWWDWSRKGSALYKDFQNAADLRMEHLPIGLTEVAIQNPKVATRIGKFSLDTPASDILDAVKDDVQGGNITKAEGGSVTDSDEFRNWFGNSVTHTDGDPHVFYTGTSKDKDFTSFNVGRHGAWFTRDPALASQYAEQNDSQGYKQDGWKLTPINTASRVIPAYVKAENPYTGDLPDEVLRDNYKKAQSDWFDTLRRKGHDAWIPARHNGDLVVVLKEPQQIKSIFNNGKFDPNQKHMNKAEGGEVDNNQPNNVVDLGFKRAVKNVMSDEPPQPVQDLMNHVANRFNASHEAYLAAKADGAFDALPFGDRYKYKPTPNSTPMEVVGHRMLHVRGWGSKEPPKLVYQDHYPVVDMEPVGQPAYTRPYPVELLLNNPDKYEFISGKPKLVKRKGGAVDDAIALTRRFTKDGAGATMALKPKGK